MPPPDQTTQFANLQSPKCSQEIDCRNDSNPATKLLISIRNSEEAAAVRDAGVDWIDLKEPHAGALGRPSLAVAASVAELLVKHSQRSAALGELCDLDLQVALDFAALFPFLKVGLSRADSLAGGWQLRFQSLAAQLSKCGSELIPVAYADASICGAPNLKDVLQLAEHVSASHMLIDTYVKDGRGLLDWVSLEELQQVIQSAREFKCGIVLAGSLCIANVSKLLELQPAALAVRGAVCESNSVNTITPHVQSRTTSIDLRKVELWRRSI